MHQLSQKLTKNVRTLFIKPKIRPETPVPILDMLTQSDLWLTSNKLWLQPCKTLQCAISSGLILTNYGTTLCNAVKSNDVEFYPLSSNKEGETETKSILCPATHMHTCALKIQIGDFWLLGPVPSGHCLLSFFFFFCTPTFKHSRLLLQNQL